MENKEKQIEEMAYIIENAFKVYFGANDLVEPEDFPYQAKDLAKELLEHYQPKIPEDSIVLSREEYDNLKLEIQKAHNKGVQAGFDMTKFKEESIKRKARKEMAEKNFKIVKKIIDKKYAIETPWTRVTLSSIINQIEKEFIKQFDMKVENDR